MPNLYGFSDWKTLNESYSFRFDPDANYPDQDFGLPQGKIDSGKVGYGGEGNNWGGSMERTLAFAKIANEFMGKNVIVSQKRSRVKTAKGTVSDHYEGKEDAYAVDLSCKGAEGDRLLAHLMEWFGHPEYKGGKWFSINKGGYRYQFGWRVKDHYDHIHIGVRKTNARDSKPSRFQRTASGNDKNYQGAESGVYKQETGDPYEYKVIDGIWWTRGPKIEEWTSLEQNKEANDILDARYPKARSRQEISANIRKYTRSAIPTKFDPAKMQAGKKVGVVSKFKDWVSKKFTPSDSKHCLITLPGDPIQGVKKTGPVPVIVLYPGIKVNNRIGAEYMPELIKQAVPDWYDKYVIVIPNEHNTRWEEVRKEIQETLKEAGLTQKNLSLGIFSGSGSRGMDITKKIPSMNLKNLILMDPTPGKDLIDAVKNLPETTNVVMEYNPKNWGNARWYVNNIDELVSEVSKKGSVQETGSPTNDHMNIPSDILIRNKSKIEDNLY
jgi:hypothetical protein